MLVIAALVIGSTMALQEADRGVAGRDYRGCWQFFGAMLGGQPRSKLGCLVKRLTSQEPPLQPEVHQVPIDMVGCQNGKWTGPINRAVRVPNSM